MSDSSEYDSERKSGSSVPLHPTMFHVDDDDKQVVDVVQIEVVDNFACKMLFVVKIWVHHVCYVPVFSRWVYMHFHNHNIYICFSYLKFKLHSYIVL